MFFIKGSLSEDLCSSSKVEGVGSLGVFGFHLILSEQAEIVRVSLVARHPIPQYKVRDAPPSVHHNFVICKLNLFRLDLMPTQGLLVRFLTETVYAPFDVVSRKFLIEKVSFYLFELILHRLHLVLVLQDVLVVQLVLFSHLLEPLLL